MSQLSAALSLECSHPNYKKIIPNYISQGLIIPNYNEKPGMMFPLSDKGAFHFRGL